MAVTYVGGTKQDFAGALALTFTIPAAATTDDFMIAFVKQSENTTGRVWDDDGGGGNGWTQLVYNRTTSGRDMESSIYYKLHSGSESNPTFTWNTSGTTEQMSGVLLVYRGTDLITPIQDWAYQANVNDGNPPNPSVTLDTAPSTVICFHGATHDDISGAFAPTGFTMREFVYGGSAQHANDHRDLFSADLSIATAGVYTPPDWQHTVANTTPEYHTYTVALQEPILIDITTVPNPYTYAGTGMIITGLGFEATQSTGKVEVWSDVTGTIKTTQTITSWADTSITISGVQGSLPTDQNVYIIVTNDNGDVTPASKGKVSVGVAPYSNVLSDLTPDHLWSLDDTYNDSGRSGNSKPMTVGVVGTHTFSTTTICDDTTKTWQLADILDRRECVDSSNMNVTISSKERTISSWIKLGGIQKSLSCIWKEGGGVQNLAFLVGMGNILVAQLADVASTRDNVQAYSDFTLTPGRPYHITMRYTHLEATKEMVLFIDGKLQSSTDGNPMTVGIFDSHSGDIVWGNPDNNLEMGTADINFAGQEACDLNYFATWSDNSPETGFISNADIKSKLFRRGVSPKYTIASGTESAMQTSLDAVDNLEVPDWGLGYRVNDVTGGGALELTMTNITFNERTSEHLEWRGTGTLTLVISGGSIDESLCYASGGGVIAFSYPVVLTVQGVIAGSIVEIYDNETVDIGNRNTKLSFTNSSGTSFTHTHDGTSNEVIVAVIKSGYVEIKIPFTLSAGNQTLTVSPTVENNV